MTSSPPSPADRHAFERDGWVLVPRLIGAGMVRQLALACDALVAGAGQLERDTIIRGARYQVQSATGRAGDPAVAPGVLRKITFVAAASPAFARLVADPRIRGAVATMGLPSPRCVVDQVNLKAARIGTGFPWHQDARFLPWQQREAIARRGGVNVVVAIDEADGGNGGFEVLSGTHHGGPVEFDYDTSGDNAGVFDESRRALVPLRPGDAVLFHPYLAHGSGPNPTDAPRRLAAMWFIADPGKLRPAGARTSRQAVLA